LDSERQRQFRRLIGISFILHGLVGVFFVWNPQFLRPPLGAAMPGVVNVRILEAVPGEAPPKASVVPAAKPKPVAPVKKKVVLPEQPKKLEEPKPKPKPEAKKPEPEPKPEPKPEVKKSEPKPEYDDVLANLRKEAGETKAAPTTGASRGPASDMPAGSARGVPLSPLEAAWYKRAKIHLSRSWKLAPGFMTEPLSTLVHVRLDGQGNVLDSRTERRSGNPWYDESALRAVQMASPLPPPPSAGEYSIEFRPEDLF